MKIKLAIFLILILLFACKANSKEMRNQTENSQNLNNTIIQADPLSNYSTLWGWNGRHTMGLGTTAPRMQPIQITCENWITAAVGTDCSLGIKSDSTLWAWGSNRFGEYGNGTVTDSSLIPIQIGTDNNWKFITAGWGCSFGIKNDGSLWAWGWNMYGMIGDSTKQDRPTPVQIGKNHLGKVKYISVSNYTAVIITEDGSLWTWGRNTEGQLGDGTNIDKYYPVQIGSAGEWKRIACDNTCTFAIKTDGTLWAWGRNSKGFLGDGTTISQNKPIQIGSDSDWAEISINKVTLALKADGTLWAWGWNYYAGIGDGTLKDVLIPTQIGTDTDWVSVKSLYMRSNGLKKDGTFWGWGKGWWNEETQKSDTFFIPTKMGNISNVTKILSSSGFSTLVLRDYKADPGKIETISATKVTSNSAESGGKVTSGGSEVIYQRGVCYSITANPTLDIAIRDNDKNIGEFKSTLTNLQSFRKYFYRAYLSTAAGDAYGEEKSFLTGLAKPILYKPENNEVVDPVKVTFEWNMDINEQKYRIQLSESEDFSSLVFDNEVEYPKFIYKDLKLNCKYFWRVQTINGVYLSDWSEIYSFHTIKFNTQQLLSPVEKAINVPIDCQLNWSENTKSSSYILQVSNDVDFNNFVIDTILAKNNYASSKLDYLKSYFWRVRSFIGVDSSNWSPVWMFTTLMDSVKLTSPENLSSNLGLTQNLSWAKGIYDKKYRLQVAKDNDFSNMIFDTLLNQKYDVDINNLKNYTKYFWRVRNESGDTLGYWSKIWQFKTRMTDVQLIYPENDKTGLAQKIKFIWSAVFGAEFYQLQISKNAQFTDIVYSKDSIKTTEHNVPDLELNSLYHWRVRPWNSESKGTLYWSEVWTFRTGNVGVKDESNVIRIIPNPAGDFITITIERWSPSSRWTPSSTNVIQIYNTLGEKVMTESIHPMTASHRMNIESLPKGVYFVKAGGETAKFVKM